MEICEKKSEFEQYKDAPWQYDIEYPTDGISALYKNGRFTDVI